MLKGIGNHVVTASRTGEKETQVLANINAFSQSATANATMSTGGRGSSGFYDKPILEEFINYMDPSTIRRIAWDIFRFDPVAGFATELISQLPFSDFELSGLPDNKMLDAYATELNAINIKTMFPEITLNYLVQGAFIGYVNQDNESSSYTSILPMDIEQCQLTPLPFYDRDPLIDVNIPKSLKKQASSPDERVRDEYDRYGDTLKKMIAVGKFPLDPKFTIYFSRRTLSTVVEGTSYFERIIPVWLIQKALMRGTIDLAHRRQKALLHLLIGDDDWIPDEGQLAQYVELVKKADADPIGAIIATRPQVQTNEIRSGSDFWRVDEIADYVTTEKMRGLGISEALFSNDFTVDTAANALSVFLDQLRSYRENATRRILINKIFLLIAMKNDFRIKRENKTELVTGDGRNFSRKRDISKEELMAREFRRIMSDTRVISNTSSIVSLSSTERVNVSDYYIPKVQWHKALRPEGNAEILTSLGTLEEKGLPIPLRMWAAAAGVSVAEVVRSWDDDVALRKKAQKYKERLPVDPKQQVADMFESGASLTEVISNIRKNRNGGFKNRNFDHLEMRDPDTRKLLSLKGRKFVNERANRIGAEAIARLNETSNRKDKNEKDVNSKYYHSRVSPIFGVLS